MTYDLFYNLVNLLVLFYLLFMYLLPPVFTKCVPVSNTRVRCGCIVLEDFMAIVPDYFHVRLYINLCNST